MAGTQAQGPGVSMARARVLPRDSVHSTNWFVHSAEEPSSRPNWLEKQVSAFPLKSHDFHSPQQCQHFVTPVAEVTVGLHSTTAHKPCMPELNESPASMQLTWSTCMSD